MMKFGDFIEYLTHGIEMQGIDIRVGEVDKVNSTSTYIALDNPAPGVSPNIYVEDYYKAYCSGVPMDALVEYAFNTLTMDCSHIKADMDFTEDNIKNNLYCIIINREKNEALLNKVPHMDVLDLALVPRYSVMKNASFIVDNTQCASWKITTDEVMEIAKENTFGNENYRFGTLVDMVKALAPDEEAVDEVEKELNEYGQQISMYTLTNEAMIYGAALMGSKKVLDDVYNKLQDDYYILPSSVHELIIVPKSADIEVDKLKAVVDYANIGFVEEKEYLSSSVYYYDGNSHTLTFAGNEKKLFDEANIKDNTISHGKSR